MQGYTDVMLRSADGTRTGSIIPPFFTARPPGSETHSAQFSGMLAEAITVPERVPDTKPNQDEAPVQARHERPPEILEAEQVDKARQARKTEHERSASAARDQARRIEEDEARRVRTDSFGEQRAADQVVKKSVDATSPKPVSPVPEFLREAGKLLHTLKTIVREAAGKEKPLKETKADEAVKAMQALLDLLRGVIPAPRVETLEKASASAEAALKGGGKRDIKMQPGGAPAIKAVEDFIEDLPAIKDLVTALSSSRGKDEKQTAESRGEKTETKGKHAEQSARLHEDGSREARLRMNVRDQRVNDPHSLREAVRIVKRQPAQGEDLRPGGRADKVSSVPPAEQAVMPPVKAPTAGRDSSLWMQQDSSSRMSQSVKKTSVPEPLTNARQIVEQVVERARVTVKSGMTEMRLQLNPRNMGRVGMHFSLNADGELTAKLMASNESVRQYLQENISSFAHDLADAGVVVAHIEVAAEGAGRQFTQDGKSAKQEDGERSGLFPSGLGEGLAELDPRQGANRHDGRLDVRA